MRNQFIIHTLEDIIYAMCASEFNHNIYESIISSMHDISFVIDKKMNLISINDSSKNILGYASWELIGTSIVDKIIQLSKKNQKLILRNKSNKSFMVKVISKSGDKLTLDCKIKPIIDDYSNKLHFVGVAKDITQLILIQAKLKEKNKKIVKLAQSKDQFLANMSHEIRTPLNGIIGLIDLIGEEQVSLKTSTYIDTLKTSSQSLMSVINNILDISKLNANKLSINNNNFDIKEIIKHIVSLFTPFAISKSLLLDYKIDSNIPNFLNGDSNKITQVLTNLVSNAIKFTESGYVNIFCELAESKTNKTYIKISVEDSGVGITLDNQKLLFQAFQQIDSGLNKTAQGTGLGLYISYNIIKLLGGEISINSKYLRGSKFEFTIPVETSKQIRRELDRLSADSKREFQYAEVLITDDNIINLKIAKYMLLHKGIRVITASSGYETIDLFNVNYFCDFSLVDIQMPYFDGIQTLNVIKKINPDVIVVALTAYAAKKDQDFFLGMGFNQYLPKPISIRSLSSLIESLYINNLIEEKKINYSNNDAVDYSVINHLIQLTDLQIVESIISELTNEVHLSLKELFVADSTKLATILHTLKGTTVTVGFTLFQEYIIIFERELKDKNFKLHKMHINFLFELFERSVIFVTTFINKNFLL